MTEHFDLLVVGAGLSGIGVAAQLGRPDSTYVILESRESLGGTWDLFRYPGFRADSDMYTLAYRARPWTGGRRSIVDGPSILRYLQETAAELGIDRHIRFGHRVVRAAWSSERGLWTVHARHTATGETVVLTAAVLVACGGYFRYDTGHRPEFAGAERFTGRIVHPQEWPEDLDHAGKRVVIVGSGSTAVTLGPALAATAKHVTVLQRSPAYVISLPDEDPIAGFLHRALPDFAAGRVVRLKNIALPTVLHRFGRRFPSMLQRVIRRGQQRALPAGFDIDTHFTPRYRPFEQRFNIAAGGDFFRAIREDGLAMETDDIRSFDETGIVLASGRHLDADIVVTATGLELLPLGGMRLEVDGSPVDLTESVTYRGMLLSGVPNFAFVFGYTGLSWTLWVDMASAYLNRILAHMRRRGLSYFVPRRDGGGQTTPFFDYTSGYILRGGPAFPRRGGTTPWRRGTGYFHDRVLLRCSRIASKELHFR
ncbi:flavin-containing monooxygenase [Streptomyces venezuelae]|uniref:flavin-containing monooxygenase n=1 Tax=Streptomyces venezuelae TaxID=54571 RepID=UPI00362EC5B1